MGSVRHMDELCGIPARGDDDTHGVGDAFACLVDILQAFAEGVKGYADDGVGLGVEVWPPAQGFDRDRVLLDLVTTTGGGLFADVAEDFCQVRRATECSGVQQPVQLRTLRETQSGRCYRRSH